MQGCGHCQSQAPDAMPPSTITPLEAAEPSSAQPGAAGLGCASPRCAGARQALRGEAGTAAAMPQGQPPPPSLSPFLLSHQLRTTGL